MLTRDEYRPQYNDYRQDNHSQSTSWYDGKGWQLIDPSLLQLKGYEIVYQDEKCTYYRQMGGHIK
jgi:hypothetical protein